MAEKTTVARPYAQAVFDLAHSKGALRDWSNTLQLAATVVADPQVQHLGLVDAIDSKDARGMIKVVRQPVRLSRTPSRTVAAPPERGQHTTSVLKEFGFSPAEIKALKKAQVV